MKYNFIKTSDPPTIKHLRSMGFKEVLGDKDSDVVTFINDADKPVTFSDAKVVYTNKIEI
jgi:hypothetical protein